MEKDLLFLNETVIKARKRLDDLISQIKPILKDAEDELRSLYKVTDIIEKLLVKNNPLQTRLMDLDLEVKSFNLLRGVGIHTIGDLLSKTDTEIKDIEGVGKVTFNDIKRVTTDWQESQAKKLSETPHAEVPSFSFGDKVNAVGTL